MLPLTIGEIALETSSTANTKQIPRKSKPAIFYSWFPSAYPMMNEVMVSEPATGFVVEICNRFPFLLQGQNVEQRQEMLRRRHGQLHGRPQRLVISQLIVAVIVDQFLEQAVRFDCPIEPEWAVEIAQALPLISTRPRLCTMLPLPTMRTPLSPQSHQFPAQGIVLSVPIWWSPC